MRETAQALQVYNGPGFICGGDGTTYEGKGAQRYFRGESSLTAKVFRLVHGLLDFLPKHLYMPFLS